MMISGFFFLCLTDGNLEEVTRREGGDEVGT